MVRPGTIAAVLTSLVAGMATSQAPELAQQYRQRLEGARQELTHVVADFDADALRNALDREEALALQDNAQEPFVRDRARSMRRVIARAEHLERQSARLAELPPVLRPMAVLADPDGRVFAGAMRDFEPAVPLTSHGLVWTAVGLLLGLGLYRLVTFPFRRKRAAKATRVNR
ncbi:DUF2937 family protein [Chelativorans sp. AA-79]|uniref:DUF2937 family protein n=1 Tax=Chelativorans sp. AA-79 TaxID=3028735 RepID=UPI0023F9A4B4|nr:DUF2937 family protein [Chelativorans sp. AA-79]WEX11222.1 DUF2937 family protein [Chelativorans sp. AA-79]